VNNTILHDLREFLFRYTERGVHLVQRIRKVVRVDSQILYIIRDARHRADLDVPIKRETSRAFDQPTDLRTRKVLGELCELFDIHVSVHHAVLAHL
jgi:hypothetical protein